MVLRYIVWVIRRTADRQFVVDVVAISAYTYKKVKNYNL